MHFVFLFTLFLLGCAAHRTPYQPLHKKQGGYREEIREANQVVNFKANQNTKISEADLFAKFRAIEICTTSGRKYAHVLGVVDKSKSREVWRSTSSGYPSYYFGMSPYYNRYSSLGIGFSSFNTDSWNETYVYPEVEVYYSCVDKAFEPEIILREVSADEMKLLVRDLKGGLQVEKILDGSPNSKILAYGDVLLKTRQMRLQKVYQLLSFFTGTVKSIPVEIMREGRRMNIILQAKDVTESVEKSQQEIIMAACKKKDIKERAICK